jgi:hypothetical protein
MRRGDVEEGELRIVDAIKALRSESELRRLFFNDLFVPGVSGGGDAPIVLSLFGWV